MDFFNNKKGGGLTEVVFIMVIVFVLAIILSVSVFVQNVLAPIMDEELTGETNTTYQDVESRTPASFDSMFMIIFVLFWVGAIILAFFVDTHPIWFILSVIGLIAILMVAGVMANTFVELNDSLIEEGMSSNMPMMLYVMEHLVQFIVGIVFTIFISLFAKSKQ